MSPRKSPLVLVTVDEEVRALRRGPTPHYALDKTYPEAVERAGGIPLLAPYLEDDDAIGALVDTVDAVVLAGGDFDIDPALFGEPPHTNLGTLKPARTRFERAVYRHAVQRQRPLLGICGGMQLLVVERGGTLYQDLPSQRDDVLEHQQPAHKREAGHALDVTEGSLLHACLSADARFEANSTHHQAVRDAGDLVVTARSPDGIIEAVEDPSARFFLGVQWHPEAMVDHPGHQAIYTRLVDVAREDLA